MLRDRTRIELEASDWLERMKRASAADTRAFGQWVLRSPDHTRAFLMHAALDEQLRHIDPERRLSVPDELPLGYVDTADVARPHVQALAIEHERMRAAAPRSVQRRRARQALRLRCAEFWIDLRRWWMARRIVRRIKAWSKPEE